MPCVIWAMPPSAGLRHPSLAFQVPFLLGVGNERECPPKKRRRKKGEEGGIKEAEKENYEVGEHRGNGGEQDLRKDMCPVCFSNGKFTGY